MKTIFRRFSTVFTFRDFDKPFQTFDYFRHVIIQGVLGVIETVAICWTKAVATVK
jgi:hypothetical protein